jgi:hypothetical protein
MPDKTHLHAVSSVELGLEGQNHRHLINEAFNGPNPAAPPGPDLGTDIVEDFDPETLGSPSKEEVKIRKVDKDNRVRKGLAEVTGDCSPRPVKDPEVSCHLRETHDRQAAMVHQDCCPCVPEKRPTHARNVNVGLMGPKGAHEIGAVKIARSLSGT